MNDKILLNIYQFVQIIILFSIVITYSMAAFWNIKFLRITKWQSYSNIKVMATIAYISFSIIFSYALLSNIFKIPVEAGNFGIFFVRPTILLMGGAVASGARARITSLKNGGENWILRK